MLLAVAFVLWMLGLWVLAARLRRHFTPEARVAWRGSPRQVVVPDLFRPGRFTAAGQRLRAAALAWFVVGAAVVVLLYRRQ